MTDPINSSSDLQALGALFGPLWKSVSETFENKSQVLKQNLDSYMESFHSNTQKWIQKGQEYYRLSSIYYWGLKLSETVDIKTTKKAVKNLGENFTPEDRALMWEEVTAHYYLSGTIIYQPEFYREPREKLALCIQNSSHQLSDQGKFLLPDTCIPPGDKRREDPLWLAALLSFNPTPISQNWLERHLISLAQSDQIHFIKTGNPDNVLIDAADMPRADGSVYPLEIHFMDGYEVDENELLKIINKIYTLNNCLVGNEVQRIYFQKKPLPDPKDPKYISSYYSPGDHEIYLKVGPAVMDALEHEFDHAIHIKTQKVVAPYNMAIKAHLDSFDVIYAQVLPLGALTLVKDAYYNVYNVDRHLLARGHPEDETTEGIASLMSAISGYPLQYLQNVYGPDTPKEHTEAGAVLWDWQQEWLHLVCTQMTTQYLIPYPNHPVSHRVYVPLPPPFKKVRVEDLPFANFIF